MTHIVPIRHDVFSEIRKRRHLRRLVDVIVARKPPSSMTVDCDFLGCVTTVNSDAWFEVGDAFSDDNQFGDLSELFAKWTEIKHPTVHAIYALPHTALRTLTAFRRSTVLMGFDPTRAKMIRDVTYESAGRQRSMDAELLSGKDIERTRLFLESAGMKQENPIDSEITDVLVDAIEALTERASADTGFVITTQF